MKTAQLIKREEHTIYLKDGEVVRYEKDTEKIGHILSGLETKLMITEEIICRLRYTTKKELDTIFWAYIETEKVDSRNYYIIIDN